MSEQRQVQGDAPNLQQEQPDGGTLDTSWATVTTADQEGDDARNDGLSEAPPLFAPADDDMADVDLTDNGVEGYAIGGGWYQFDDGSKVQGREQAAEYLSAHPQ